MRLGLGLGFSSAKSVFNLVAGFLLVNSTDAYLINGADKLIINSRES